MMKIARAAFPPLLNPEYFPRPPRCGIVTTEVLVSVVRENVVGLAVILWVTEELTDMLAVGTIFDDDITDDIILEDTVVRDDMTDNNEFVFNKISELESKLSVPNEFDKASEFDSNNKELIEYESTNEVTSRLELKDDDGKIDGDTESLFIDIKSLLPLITVDDLVGCIVT